MLSKIEKIQYFKDYLEINPASYAEEFRTDILIFFYYQFDEHNSLLKFLDYLTSQTEIAEWIDKLVSRIVMKFDEEHEQIGDFIYEYIYVTTCQLRGDPRFPLIKNSQPMPIS